MYSDLGRLPTRGRRACGNVICANTSAKIFELRYLVSFEMVRTQRVDEEIERRLHCLCRTRDKRGHHATLQNGFVEETFWGTG